MNNALRIGVDPATATGICFYLKRETSLQDRLSDISDHESRYPSILLYDHSVKPAKKEPSYYKAGRFLALMEDIERKIRSLGFSNDQAVICYEGLVNFQGKGKIAMQQGHELRGVLQAYCCKAGIFCFSIPATTLKKQATGKGNAGKELMITACLKDLHLRESEGYQIQKSKTKLTDNMADAYHCAMQADKFLNESELA